MTAFESIANAISAALRANATFLAMGIKVLPLKITQGDKPPVVTYMTISDIPYDDINGTATLYRAIIEYKIHSLKFNEAGQIEENIRLALQGYSGQNLGITIKGVYHLHTMDDFESEVGEYNKIARFSVLYRRE